MDDAKNCPNSVLSGYWNAVEGTCRKFVGNVAHPAKLRINQINVILRFMMEDS